MHARLDMSRPEVEQALASALDLPRDKALEYIKDHAAGLFFDQTQGRRLKAAVESLPESLRTESREVIRALWKEGLNEIEIFTMP